MKLKTVDKFVLKAYIGPMFATFFIVYFILLMNGLWLFIDEIVGKGLPISAIAKLIFYFSSTMIPLGLPLATLLAAIMTMGNMGENYELTALKSAGISLIRIIRPIMILAFAISVASFFIINNYVPYSMDQVGKVLSDIRSQRQEIEFSDGMFFNGIPDISIRVNKQNKSNRRLYGVLIYDNRDREMAKTIVADSGYIAMSGDKKFMSIELYNGENIEDNRNFYWHDRPTLRTNQFSYQLMKIELDGFNFQEGETGIYDGRSETKNVNELQQDIDSLSVIANERINKFINTFVKDYIFASDTSLVSKHTGDSLRNVLNKREKILLTLSTLDTMPIETQKSIYDDAFSRLQNLKFYTEGAHAQITGSTVGLYRSMADWHKKIALPFSVFIFFLIGAPLGAIIRRGGLGLPVVISVIFFIIYYVLTLIGERFVKEGAMVPILGMWISSLVLAPIAIFLTYKAKKDSQLLSTEAYIIILKRLKNKIKEKHKK